MFLLVVVRRRRRRGLVVQVSAGPKSLLFLPSLVLGPPRTRGGAAVCAGQVTSLATRIVQVGEKAGGTVRKRRVPLWCGRGKERGEVVVKVGKRRKERRAEGKVEGEEGEVVGDR